MTINEIVQIVGAKIICGKNLASNHVNKAFVSGLLNNILTFDAESIYRISGLNNVQTIRTTEISDKEVITILSASETAFKIRVKLYQLIAKDESVQS